MARHYDDSPAEYYYPPLDPEPAGGAKVAMLTDGNQQVIGTWPRDYRARGLKGWADLVRRNKDKERQLGYLKNEE